MVDFNNIEEEIQDVVKELPDNNYLLGRGLVQPFNPANSGSRKLMTSVHREHLLIPINGEIPIIQTGFETEFGVNSSSFIVAESNYEVLYKIPKYSFRDDHYYLIIRDTVNDQYDIIERVNYMHNTESYGYIFNNEYLDNLDINSKIKKGDVLKTSNGFDKYYNKMDGVNLITMYLSCDQNMEDSIIISESAAKKMETASVKNTSITINDNDILLNLYGNENEYKAFPDIGEEIKDGIFCSIRRVENDTVLYTLSQSNLRDIMISDKNILIEGQIADINVYCNDPDALKESYYNQQLYFYYNQQMQFCKQVNDLVGPLAMQGKLSYNLQKIYARCRDIISGKLFFKDKQFNNVIMEVTIIETLKVNQGDKFADRYGGKGVISQIRPDELMPKLDNGKHVEIIKNQSTCINRENIGQLHEQSLTFIGSRMLDYFRLGVLSYVQMARLWYDFVSELDKEQADFMYNSFNFNDEYESKMFIDSLLEDDSIVLSLLPFTTNVEINKIAELYKKFTWIKPYEVTIPIEDSNGDIRYIPTRRPLIIGKIYNYRLKQYAEEKFSVTSLSATNLKNLNTRSRANKMYESRYTKTPIMFGPMESGDLSHLSMEYVIMQLMIYSVSPQGRRLFEQLLVGDPYNIDIKLDKGSKNRNAEIINVLFKTMGLRLKLSKSLKKKEFLVKRVIYKNVPNSEYKLKTNIFDYITPDYEQMLQRKLSIAKFSDKDKEKLLKYVPIKRVDNNNVLESEDEKDGK